MKEQRDDADLDPEMMVGDTPRITTELETWHPSLGMPPFPISVIDELRGKYSRFRTRHTDEYIAEQLAKDEMNGGQEESNRIDSDTNTRICPSATKRSWEGRKAKSTR